MKGIDSRVIGVGPGDPELLTLKAKRILEAADVIAVPVKEAGEKSTALEIIRPVVCLEHKELLEVVFRMARDKEERSAAGKPREAADGHPGYGKDRGHDYAGRCGGLQHLHVREPVRGRAWL